MITKYIFDRKNFLIQFYLVVEANWILPYHSLSHIIYSFSLLIYYYLLIAISIYLETICHYWDGFFICSYLKRCDIFISYNIYHTILSKNTHSNVSEILESDEFNQQFVTLFHLGIYWPLIYIHITDVRIKNGTAFSRISIM